MSIFVCPKCGKWLFIGTLDDCPCIYKKLTENQPMDSFESMKHATLKIVPFDAEKAKKGAKLITRDAIENDEQPNARYLGEIKSSNGFKHMIAIERDDEDECVISVRENGREYFDFDNESGDDIFMVANTKRLWGVMRMLDSHLLKTFESYEEALQYLKYRDERYLCNLVIAQIEIPE